MDLVSVCVCGGGGGGVWVCVCVCVCVSSLVKFPACSLMDMIFQENKQTVTQSKQPVRTKTKQRKPLKFKFHNNALIKRDEL